MHMEDAKNKQKQYETKKEKSERGQGKATITKRSKNAELIVRSINLIEFYNTHITPLASIFKPMTSRAGICPFHKDTDPSFHAHVKKNFYHCFGCQYTGDIIAVYRQIQNNYYQKKLTEKEAIKGLAALYNIQLLPDEESDQNMDMFETARMILKGESFVENYTGEVTIGKYERTNMNILQSNLAFSKKIAQLAELDLNISAYLIEEEYE